VARRAAYTKIKRGNFSNPPHVQGMSDKAFRVFQCLNKDCTNLLVEQEDSFGDDFSVKCPKCEFVHQAGEVATLYDYELVDERDGGVVEAGNFEILHNDYVNEAARFKYCIVCGALKPMELFDRHSGRETGRQGECNLCKQVYNSIKNQTRLPEQHREAAQKRRLYTHFEDPIKLDIEKIYERFGKKCFKCQQDLANDLVAGSDSRLGNLDHTLPVFFLWPLTTDNATLLCRQHNGEKAEKWPRDFYSDAELRRLAALTGIEYKVLAGPSQFNPASIARLQDGSFVEQLFEKFARYPEELLRLRNRVLKATGADFLSSSAKLSSDWKVKADQMA